jgi:hypothetical protein
MAAAPGSGRVILFLAAAGLVAWWSWGRGLSRQQLFACAAGLAGLWLLLRGDPYLAILLFLPGLWLVAHGQLRPKNSPAMDPEEARRVLGLPPDADADAIRAAHRRLVTRVHPDQGGSADLAQRVNAARDILLAERQKR